MPTFSDPVTEIHEERLQRLESGMQTVATTTALTNQKVDHLVEAVKDGFHTVNTRLDKGAQQFDQHEVALAEHRAEIASLKQAERSRANRWSSVKRAALPLLAAAAGVIGTETSQHFVDWISKLLHH